MLLLSWSCSHTLSTGCHFEPAQFLLKKYHCTSWYERCTYQMIPLLVEISIFCVRTYCKVWLVSYGSKHSSQYFPVNPFVHAYTCITWQLQVIHECSAYRMTALHRTHSLCGLELWSNPTAELWPQTHIGRSLIQTCVRMLQLHIYIAVWCANMHDNRNSHTLWLHITHQTTALLPTTHHYNDKVGWLHYTFQCLFS